MSDTKYKRATYMTVHVKQQHKQSLELKQAHSVQILKHSDLIWAHRKGNFQI